MARSLDGELARVRTFRELTGAMWQAGDLDDILQGALACLEAIFGVERASILLFDEAGVMRFRAWRGLSDAYRVAVGGHSPWAAGETAVEPVLVSDVSSDLGVAELAPALVAEGIGAISYYPLVGSAGVFGKFAVCYPEARELTELDREYGHLLANQIAVAIERHLTEERLRQSSEELAVILRGVGDGITVVSPSYQIIYANEAAARVLGAPSVEALLGASAADLLERFEVLDKDLNRLPPDRGPSRVAMVERRELEADLALRVVAGESSELEPRRVFLRSTPILDPSGEVRFVVNILRDVTEQARAEALAVAALDRLARLHQVTAALSEALSVEEVCETVAHHGREALGAAGTAVYLVDEARQRIELVASSGEIETIRGCEHMDLDAANPIADATRSGSGILLADGDERRRAYAELARIDELAGSGALAAIPIADYGAIGFLFAGPHPFDDRDREFFAALAAQCQQALERARLYDIELAARAEAEAAEKRARFLAEAGALLGSSLDDEATLAQLARAAVPAIADWAAVDLLEDDGTTRLVAVHHRDAEKIALARRLREEYPADPERPGSAQAVARTGEPMLFAEIPEKMLHEAAQNEEHLALIKDLGIRSAMVVPIIAGERRLGAMTFITAETERRYNESDLIAAVQLGNRAGIALENARLYQAEREARAAARAAEQRKDEFLAILGHELRNPLAPIVTALELMDLDPSSASFPKAREIIERQVRYLQRLVDDLLDVSRITTGKLQLRRETVEVSAAIRDAIEIASPILERRGHHLEVSLAEDALIRGDRIRLAQVFSNLLTNAAKYTEPGGRIAISSRRGDSEVVIEVADNGIGIDPEIAPRLFDLFVQGDRSFESHAVQGLGLGLTIVKRLIELHDGEISASSDGIGRGSRFEVRLPLKGGRARHSTSVELTPIPRVDGDSQRVLIVDDNIDAAEILSIALRRAGFHTAVALDGPSALVQASSFKPEVALLDIGLPVMDGYELARRLLELSEPPRRLIAITGYGQAHDRDRALAAGFDNHFVKPVTIDAIIAALAI